MATLAGGTSRQIHIDLAAIRENTARRGASSSYTPVPSVLVYDATTGALVGSGTSLTITGETSRDTSYAEILGGVRHGQFGRERSFFSFTTDAALTVI